MPQPPSLGGVTSPFGMRTNPNDGKYRMHYGEDTIGTGNYAPVTGTVVFAGFDNTGTGLGWAVGIREDDDPNVIWWVAHHGSTPKINPLVVSVGETVRERASYLGPSGTSGAAKGRHAHTERREGGAARPGSGSAADPREAYDASGSGGSGRPVRRKGSDMALMFYKTGTSPVLYAIAGGSPGTPANWLETTSSQQEFANALATQVGGAAAGLSPTSWDAWKKAYLSPVATTGASGTVPSGLATKADVDAAGAKTTADVTAKFPTTFKAV